MLSRSTLLVVALAATVACDKVPLGAPTGSSITVTTAAQSVSLNGSTVITAFVSEGGGNSVQNGTTVTFTTTLGSLQPSDALTTNGRATTTLHAGTASGVAQIRATSGASNGGTGTTATNVVEVRIGAAAAGSVIVSATPSSVPSSGGTVSVTAAALDASGNRLVGVPVSFSTSAGSLSASSATTGPDGQATVELTTDRTATVTARLTGGGGTDTGVSGTVTVNAAAANSLALTVAPSPATVGTPVVATITPTIGANNLASRVVINWGDGNQDDLGVVAAVRTVAHSYSSAGTFAVVATGTGNGESTSASAVVVVNPRAAIGVTVAVAPAAPARGSTATFTATVSGDTTASIQSYRWRFEGSGISGETEVVTTGNVTSKVFTETGTKTVTVTATTTDGRTGVGVVQFTVGP